jgi:hypothetical protein
MRLPAGTTTIVGQPCTHSRNSRPAGERVFPLRREDSRAHHHAPLVLLPKPVLFPPTDHFGKISCTCNKEHHCWAECGPEKVDAADEQLDDIPREIKDAALLVQQYARERKQELADRKASERATNTKAKEARNQLAGGLGRVRRQDGEFPPRGARGLTVSIGGIGKP